MQAGRRAREGTVLESVAFGIVDLETTGLAAGRDRILEIGLVVQRAGRTLERFSTLIDVRGPIPRFITELTGIDAEESARGLAEPDALAAFARVLGARQVEVLVAHNARFDRGFLEKAWAEHGCAPALPPFLCSLKLARKWLQAPSYRLDVLVEQLGLPPAARHRALGDAEMTARLWHELVCRGQLRGVHTLEALRAIAEVKPSASRSSRVRVVDSRSAIG